MALKLLPLSLYVEVQYLFLLLSIIRGDRDVDINNVEEAVETIRRLNGMNIESRKRE